MPKYLKTDSREIAFSEKTITILRCEIEACVPSNAHEECFIIKQNLSGDAPDELTVENTGYGNISVVYSIIKNKTIAISNESKIGIKGSLDICFGEGSVSLFPKVDSLVTLFYSKGEHFNIHPGDKICSGSKVLIDYINDGWDDSDW
jgi:hypothetical protein